MRRPAVAACLVVLALVVGCGDHDHDHGAEPAEHAHGEAEHAHGGAEHAHGEAGHDDHGDESAIAITHFSDATELFVEHPPLVVGEHATFAAHLTRLLDFGPVDTGRAAVFLTGGGAPEERFEAQVSDTPGIFRVVVTPTHAAERTMALLHLSDKGPDRHDLGAVTVYADHAAAAQTAPTDAADEGLISFLKEQQWHVPFATAPAIEEALQPRVRAWATVVARSDGTARIVAPAPGRLSAADQGRYALGARLEEGTAVALIAQPLSAESDPASLDLAVEKARLARAHARKERERLEELVAAGAVPERRVRDARLAEDQAAAELRAAERRRKQQQRAQDSSGSGAIEVRAPIGGVVTEIEAPLGSLVEQGQPLARVVDLSRVHVEVRVPEANLAALGQPGGVVLDLVGLADEVTLAGDQLVAGGGIVDPISRTVPYIYTAGNADGRLRLGMSGTARLASGDPIRAVAVPATAIVSDGALEVVFVLRSGEAFERRIVQTGVRDRGLIAITSGLAPGERVVTKGAWLVKLAASATAVPGHGHAH